MTYKHCKGCDRKTGHKRSLGMGTLIMLFLTGGLWLFMIFLYPSRCIICGRS